MQLCEVTAKVTATIKNPGLAGFKLLLCQPVGMGRVAQGLPLIAVDTVGAGRGDLVMVTTGNPARAALRNGGPIPVDAVIIAIVEHIEGN